jgi:hypothetical protein
LGTSANPAMLVDISPPDHDQYVAAIVAKVILLSREQPKPLPKCDGNRLLPLES